MTRSIPSATHLVFVVVAAAESPRAGSAARLARDEDEGARVAGRGRPRAGRGPRRAGEGRLAVRRPDGVELSLLGLREVCRIVTVGDDSESEKNPYRMPAELLSSPSGQFLKGTAFARFGRSVQSV